MADLAITSQFLWGSSTCYPGQLDGQVIYDFVVKPGARTGALIANDCIYTCLSGRALMHRSIEGRMLSVEELVPGYQMYGSRILKVDIENPSETRELALKIAVFYPEKETTPSLLPPAGA